MTPDIEELNNSKKGVILYLKFLLHLIVTPKRVKTTQKWSKNNPIFRVILTPDWELKELCFRSKNDPKFGVKSGVKVKLKKGLSSA